MMGPDELDNFHTAAIARSSWRHVVLQGKCFFCPTIDQHFFTNISMLYCKAIVGAKTSL